MQAIDPTTHTPAIPPLKVGSFSLRSRLVVGTGKYRDFEQTRAAIDASGADAVTVAVRRERLYDAQGRSLLDALPLDRLTVLPNTAGCFTADDAVRVARLGRDLLEQLGNPGARWVKLEVLGDKATLLPDPVGTLEATRELVKDGFEVLVYSSDDPVLAKRLEDVGVTAVMPAGAPIGSGQGILNPNNIRIILERAKVPVIVDAGVGTASDVAVAFELGAHGVLLNTGVASAKDPVRMARAMKAAAEAGRDAFLAGRIGKKLYLPVGVLDVLAPDDHAVVLHEHGLVVLADAELLVGEPAGLAQHALGDADLAEEDLGLGDEARGDVDVGDGEGGGVRRVRVHDGLDLGPLLVARDVDAGLAGAHAGAGELFAVEVHEAHVLGLHEALADQRGRAEGEVVADADGDVAAVAVGVLTLPEAAAHLADPFLQDVDRGRVEEFLDLGGRLRVGTGRPAELVIGDRRSRRLLRRRRGLGGARALERRLQAAAAEHVARGGRQDGTGRGLLAFAQQFLGFTGSDDFRHGESG